MEPEAVLRETPLAARHKALGAKMVDFHGWMLPIYYGGILDEHETVRRACGLFDVSHMAQIEVSGPDAVSFWQRLIPTDAAKLHPGKAVYTHLLNERGGIVDDLIVSGLAPDRTLAVVNAATTEKDWTWLEAHRGKLRVNLRRRSPERGIIAVQGPGSRELLAMERGLETVSRMRRFEAWEGRAFGTDLFVSTTGYTGEEGFEIMAPAKDLPRIWDAFLDRGASRGVKPCGLGARDTLRLEAGYLLYGQDADDEHSSLEAGYGWLVDWDKGEFIGKEALMRQKKEGLARRLYGLRLKEAGIPRAGAVVSIGGRTAGSLTSAGFSPTLKVGLGLGYLDQPGLKPGDAAVVGIRGRSAAAEVVKLPFYSHA
jgi:aminomethyltransferase